MSSRTFGPTIKPMGVNIPWRSKCIDPRCEYQEEASGRNQTSTLLNPNLNLDAVYAGIEVRDDAVGAEVDFKLDLERTDSNAQNNHSTNAGQNNASQGDKGSRRARASRRG